MRILVALDGSILSEHALEGVVPLVRQTGAEVVLVAVLNPDAIHETVATGGYRETASAIPAARLAIRGAPAEPPARLAEDRGQALESARTTAEDALRAAAKALPGGAPVTFVVAWSRYASEAILEEAKARAADLIVVGSHGRGGFRQTILGSVSAELVRESPVPVVVIGQSVRAG
jgi:nucleotide-binding universal stress UspA family protein